MSKYVKSLWALPLAAIAGTAIAQETQSAEQLDQRIRVLERKLELQQEADAAAAKKTATVSASDKGFAIQSADKSFQFKFRGLLQADGRFFLDDQAPRTNDGFLLRRVEPTFELTFAKVAFLRIQPNFAPDSATVSDAYGELRLNPAFNVRAGKFKEPLTLENLQSSSAIRFNERGFPTELGANRDFGVQLGGKLLSDGWLSYAVGVFNGAPDGRDGAQQPGSDNRKEIAARLFAEPFKNGSGFLQGLGFGISGSFGEKEGTGDLAKVKYRTPGQNGFFSYLSTISADGDHTRISPQAYFYHDSFGLLGEYIVSKQAVTDGTNSTDIENKAWQAVASYVLTGEDNGYGTIQPKHGLGDDGWGAFEVLARYGQLDIDNDAFPLYADPTKSASKADTLGVGVNWYATRNLKIALAYTRTTFDGGAASGDRENENVIFSRFQIAF